MKEELEIELKYKRKDFEELYFDGNQCNYFFSKKTKKPLINLLLSIVALIFLQFYLFSKDSGFIGIIILEIITLYCFVKFSIGIYSIWKRRKKVKNYLNNLDRIRNHKIILKDDKFEIKQDDRIFSENWTDFEKPEINKMFIYLNSKKENYLIPKKSMSDLQYQKFISVLREKI